MTNLIRNRREHKWAGFKMFKCYYDGHGNHFKDGARYVVFDNGMLVAEELMANAAEKAFLEGKTVEGGVKLQDYLGIDTRLR